MFIRFDYKDMPVPLERAIEELKKRGGTLFENRPRWNDYNYLCLSNGQILFSDNNISDDDTEIFYDKFGDYFFDGRKLPIESYQEIVGSEGVSIRSDVVILRNKAIFAAKKGDYMTNYAAVFVFSRISIDEVFGFAIRNGKYEEVCVGTTSQAYRPANKSEIRAFEKEKGDLVKKSSWKPNVGDIFYLPTFTYTGFTTIKATYKEGYNFISDNRLAFPTEDECQKFCEYLNKKFKAAINEY